MYWYKLELKLVFISFLCLLYILTVEAGTLEDLRERLQMDNVKKEENMSTDESKGKIENEIKGSTTKGISIITCYDNKHSYAVCLPQNYSKLKRYPVLFCFDPGGDGITAVQKFKYATEKYEWIVVGSLDAKNGPWEPILRAQKFMIRDVKKRYSIDEKKFYAVGFSGGARMAYTIAYMNSQYFKAVIACGAGFGKGNIKRRIAVYHCVGDEDFNLDEVKKAYDKLKRKRIKTEFNEFSGDHRWPPTYAREEAVDWIASIN